MKTIIEVLGSIEGMMALTNTNYDWMEKARNELSAMQDAFEQVCEQLNYWLPPNEPNTHCTDKVSQFHQEKWLQACKALENASLFRKTGV